MADTVRTIDRGAVQVLMTSYAPPICGGCRHLTGRRLFDPTHPSDPARCAAFPVRIPWDVLLSKADHRKPFLGDLGIRFEPTDATAAEYASRMFAGRRETS